MSIIGLSEKLRLPRKGKIRLGEKKLSKQGKEYPSALDYFVVPEEVAEVYPDKPRKLDIMFPMENRDDFFPQWYKRYGSSKGLICKGDGKTATEILASHKGKLIEDNKEIELGKPEMKEIDCEGKECPYYQSKECKQVGNLQIILPKVKGLGVYQIDTSSYNSIININSGIELIRGMLARVGINRISWIPLVLEVKMQEAHPVVKNKRIKTIIPVMSVDLEMSVELMMKMLKGSALPAPQAEVDNPDVDDKPELLFSDEANINTGDKVNFVKTGIKFDATNSEKNEIEKVNKLGETEVKDKVLSEEEAQKEQDRILEESKQPDYGKGRNQLNIRWHTLRKKLVEINFFGDDESYRDWLKFSFKVGSSKELSDEKMNEGIALMAKIFNEQEKEK